MPLALADDLAIYLNGQVKRIKQRKEKFIPLDRLFEYCQNMTQHDGGITPEIKSNDALPANVLKFSDYKK